MYNIAILRSIYRPDIHLDMSVSFYNDFFGNPVDFEFVRDAQEQVAKWEKARVVLAYNEYSPAKYVIVENNISDYILSGRNSDISNYDWDNTKCDCGECSECFELMISQDRKYILDHAETE